MVGFVKGKKPDLSGLARSKGRPPASIGGKGGGVTKKPVGTAKPVGGMPNISGSKGSVAPMPSTGSSARRPNPRTRPGFSDGGTTKMTKSEMPSKMGKVKTSPTRDGVAKKGKTKGTMVKMMKSGGAC
jgi:hypothetical protein